MDYPTWRKKPPSQQFINFSSAYRLDQLVNEERSSSTTVSTASTTSVSTFTPKLEVSSSAISVEATAINSERSTKNVKLVTAAVTTAGILVRIISVIDLFYFIIFILFKTIFSKLTVYVITQ